MKTKLSILLAMFWLLPLAAFSQTFDKSGSQKFNEYRQQQNALFDGVRKEQNQKFDDYLTKRQQDFAEFLKQRWELFSVYAGIERPPMPEPHTAPVADPTENIPAEEVPVKVNPVSTPDPEPEPVPVPVPDKPVTPAPVPDEETEPVDVSPAGNILPLSFLGHDLKLRYDPEFQVSLKNVEEESVGEYWSMLSRTDYLTFMSQCLYLKQKMNLNDWAYYLLVKDAAHGIYGPGHENEEKVFTAYILDSSGYKIRFGTDQDRKNLLLMIAVSEPVYGLPYMTVGNSRYYIVDKMKGTQLFSYKEMKRSNDNCDMSLTITQPMKPANTVKYRNFESKAAGNLKIAYSPYMAEFYNRMPDSHLSTYLNSKGSVQVDMAIEKEFGRILAGKSDYEKVAILLKFMHELPYMTDDEQFGREKYFYHEEVFAYPYCDCEDRTALFTYMVKNLVGLDAVGLLYEGHAAAAVRFDENVGGMYVTHNGAKYTICDPTYINSRIGQAMPDYVNKSATIIPVM